VAVDFRPQPSTNKEVSAMEHDQLRDTVCALQQQIADHQAEAQNLRDDIAAIRRSLSWRITAPLRALGDLAPKVSKSALAGLSRLLKDEPSAKPRDLETASPPRPAPYPYMDFPILTPKHVPNARLYSDRMEMFRALKPRPGAVIGEVGVAHGRFSAFLIDEFKPSEFVAFDLFNLHTVPVVWGQSTAVLFEGKTHLEFYRNKFAGKPGKIFLEEGLSDERLSTYPDSYFDILYIDAGHTYECVKSDAAVAKKKVKPDGLLVFNDYIMCDHLNGGAYGVVPAVNELIVEDGWEVVAFALAKHMFCDIALRRAGTSTGT
jgi:Methyltransferase domain